MEEFTQYYVLARELSTFQKKWNKDKQYKSYEKAAKKLEKEKKKEEYTCWLQQQFVESMMGATSMLEILFDGDTREKAFLWEAIENELDKAATEEIIETVAIIALTRGYGSLVKAADTAGDVAKTAKRLDTVADTLDNLNDASRALDKIRDVEKIDDVTDKGWDGDPIDVVRMPDGGLTTIDNTRVVAARQAGIDVQANIHAYDDLLPVEYIDRFTTKKGVPTTWGDAITLRIGKQNSTFRNNNPFGSFDMGNIN